MLVNQEKRSASSQPTPPSSSWKHHQMGALLLTRSIVGQWCIQLTCPEVQVKSAGIAWHLFSVQIQNYFCLSWWAMWFQIFKRKNSKIGNHYVYFNVLIQQFLFFLLFVFECVHYWVCVLVESSSRSKMKWQIQEPLLDYASGPVSPLTIN